MVALVRRAQPHWPGGRGRVDLVGCEGLAVTEAYTGLYGHGSPRGALRPKRLAKGFVVAAARGSFVLERAGGYSQELGVCAVGALEGVLAAR